MPDKKMFQSDAARIQSTQATGGKDTGAGSFASRAQSAGDTNANHAAAAGNTGGDQGGQSANKK